ncbi:MAG: FliM/FliN family flagellar motor switch protein [Actinomycetota bacterium]|nr:FliM/FliN family flagellar motor switch protein [Actinomycetota bacterium]
MTSTATEPGQNRASQKRTPRSFDFRKPKSLERNQLRSLQMVLESFLRAASSVLTANMRIPFRLTIGELEQKPWEEVISLLEDPASIAVFSLPPLPSKALWHMPLELSMRLIDMRLGGNGKGDIPKRPLSDLERVIIKNLTEDMLAQIVPAFAPITSITLGGVNLEASTQFVQLVSLSEMCVLAQIEISASNEQPISTAICLPFPLLRPITEILNNRANPIEDEVDHTLSHNIEKRLYDVPVEVTVEFEPTLLTSREIVSLSPGDVVRLSHRKGQPLRVRVDSTELYLAQPTQVGKRVACVLVEPEETK